MSSLLNSRANEAASTPSVTGRAELAAAVREAATAHAALPALSDIVALTKPRITLMSVLVAAGALGLAPVRLSLLDGTLALLATGLSVAGAGALNMYLERDIDGRMARTKVRPLPSGRMAPLWAVFIGLALALTSIPVMAIASNGSLAPALTAFAIFAYVLVYTPMKQVSPWALVVGSVPGAMPAVMGYTAASGALDPVVLCLFGVTFFWQLPHFLAIGVYRERDYLEAGHKLFTAGKSPDYVKTIIVATAVPLVPCAVMLWPLEVGSWVYGAIASLLSVWFIALCVSGFSAENLNKWARRVFLGTLVYQTVLFAALALDVGIRALFF